MVPLDEDVCMDPRSFCLSPSVPQFQDSIAQAHLYNTYGMGMCGPTYLLERLGPHILRSHVSSVQFKPIPNDYSVNLDSFRYKDPREWGLDDVIGWMISVAKRHNIPIEDMNMHRFSDCNGPLLNLMTQQSFADRDAVYGPLLFAEYRRMLGDDSDQNILDKLMLTTTHSDGPGTSGLFQRASCSQSAGHHVIEKPIPISLSSCKKDLDGPDGLHHSQQPTSSHSASSTAPYASVIRPNPAALSTAGEWPAEGQLIGKSSTRPHLLAPKKKGPKPRLNDYEIKTEGVTEGALSDLGSPGSVGSGGKELKRRKDGKPRRRSQHTKGNKLWEFIRDALKDTETCPSIVKWEDPEEGVFRIVESEKLAKLWGEKKNNQKMTYEKLSRAMRTYYEKKILLPVPKTGLYPKKLVYKFGPCTHGWKAGETALISPNSSAVAADNSASTTTSNAKVSVKSTAAIPKSIGSRIKAAQERRDGNLQLQNAGETRGTQSLATVNPPAPQYDYDNNVKAEPVDSDPDDLDDRSESGRLQIDQFDDVSSDEDNEDLVVDEME